MIKCQSCGEAATLHVTEIAAGKPAEYHVCEKHFRDVQSLQPTGPKTTFLPWEGLWKDPEICTALAEPVARQKMAAYVLPALCVALLDHKPEVRLHAAFRIMQHGSDAKSALGALHDALDDSDERVRKVVEVAIELIESEQQPLWFL